MPDIHAALSRLQPPLHYQLDQNGDQLTLVLSDSQLNIQAVRSVSLQEYQNPGRFRVSVLYAINELRGKGSVVEFSALPYWD